MGSLLCGREPSFIDKIDAIDTLAEGNMYVRGRGVHSKEWSHTTNERFDTEGEACVHDEIHSRDTYYETLVSETSLRHS